MCIRESVAPAIECQVRPKATGYRLQANVARGAQIVATRFIPTEPPVPASLTLSGQDSSCSNTIAACVKPDADQESSDAQKEASARSFVSMEYIAKEKARLVLLNAKAQRIGTIGPRIRWQ